MTINRLIVALSVVLSVTLGAGLQGEALAQKAKPQVKKTTAAKTNKAKQVRARATAKPRTASQRKGTTVKLKTRFGSTKPSRTTSKPAEALKTATKGNTKKISSTKARKAAEAAKGAAASAVGETGETVNPAAEAKRLTKAERKEAKAKEKAKNSVIPERKTPIHQQLKDPNFFGEKDTPTTDPNIEAVSGSHAAIKRLKEPSNLFLSGDVGRLMSARFVNRPGRNDADFRYSYGEAAFKNFAKADALLDRIPPGKFAKNLSVELLTDVNRTAFAEGGDSLMTRVGKTVRNVFNPNASSKKGQLRNYQSVYFASKGLSKQEAKNLSEHGASYVKLPFTRAGWIVYAPTAKVRPRLDALIKSTKAKLNDPAADPIEAAATFVQEFIAIHPFADGNGRTSRLIMDRILAEKGLLPPILKNTSNDVGMTSKDFQKEVLHGVARTNRKLGLSTSYGGSQTKDVGNIRLHSAAGYVERMMKEHGHTINGKPSTTFAKHDGLRYQLGQDGFVYNSAGRPHMADKQGNLRPVSQMTLYILMRRVAQQKNAPKILNQITKPTRQAFGSLVSGKPTKKGKTAKVLSDLGAIKHDGKLTVDVDSVDSKMLISLMNPENIATKTMLTANRGSSSTLTTIMSRYQQADLEMWYVKEAFSAKGDKTSVAKIEKHRDVLFARARTELRKHVKKGDADGDNPLGAKQEFERIQYNYSPLRYGKRVEYTKKHGDSEAYIFRGENFAKWTGVHIDSALFRPGLKDAAGMRAKNQGSLNLYDALKAVQGDTVGTGVQSYTTDLALLARKGGFADSHKNVELNLSAMPKMGKALINMRLKDGEVLEVKSNTSLMSALFSRKIATQPGHFSVDDIGTKELDALIETHAPAEKAAELSKRAADARGAKKGMLSGITSLFGKSRRKEVKVDDLMSEGELKSFSTALHKARNLVTVKREGDSLKVTAHRRANVFKVQKTKMLPGTDALAGTFLAEQEVHVMSSVLPNRILETYTQGHLSADVEAVKGSKGTAKDASKRTESSIVKPAAETAKVSAAGPTPPPASGTL